MDDPELMRELVGSLIDDSRQQLLALQAAIESADISECERVAHYVKGACVNLGAEAMAAELRNVEQQAVQGDFAACRSTLATLLAELQKLRAEATSL